MTSNFQVTITPVITVPGFYSGTFAVGVNYN
jgi:hypothetical protein